MMQDVARDTPENEPGQTRMPARADDDDVRARATCGRERLRGRIARPAIGIGLEARVSKVGGRVACELPGVGAGCARRLCVDGLQLGRAVDRQAGPPRGGGVRDAHDDARRTPKDGPRREHIRRRPRTLRSVHGEDRPGDRGAACDEHGHARVVDDLGGTDPRSIDLIVPWPRLPTITTSAPTSLAASMIAVAGRPRTTFRVTSSPGRANRRRAPSTTSSAARRIASSIDST